LNNHYTPSCSNSSWEKQTALHNLNCISIKIQHVYNKIINLRTILTILTLIIVFRVIFCCFHHVPIKNAVVGLLNQIVPKLAQKIRRRKKSRNKTLLECQQFSILLEYPKKWKVYDSRLNSSCFIYYKIFIDKYEYN